MNSRDEIYESVRRAVKECFPDRGDWIMAFLDLELPPRDAILFVRKGGWKQWMPRANVTGADGRLVPIFVIPFPLDADYSIADAAPSPSHTFRRITFYLKTDGPNPVYSETPWR